MDYAVAPSGPEEGVGEALAVVTSKRRREYEIGRKEGAPAHNRRQVSRFRFAPISNFTCRTSGLPEHHADKLLSSDKIK